MGVGRACYGCLRRTNLKGCSAKAHHSAHTYVSCSATVEAVAAYRMFWRPDLCVAEESLREVKSFS